VYSSYGVIDGVIHGAGVIEDRLVEEKTSESFDRVCGGKVTGAMVLSQCLRPQTLRFLTFFSSVTGRFGNRGQTDYAAANEVLNKLASHLDALWTARVVAINWGPWDASNMVTEAVRDQFLRRRVQLIESSAGCDAFLREIASGRKGEPEVILGGGPWSEAPEASSNARADALPLIESESLITGKAGEFKLLVTLDRLQHRYLTDHCLDARPVLPATMAIELMTESARKGWPDLTVTGVRSVRVCKGVVVDGRKKELSLSARSETHSSAEDSSLAIDIEISDPAGSGMVYYRGTVCLADRLPQAPVAEPRRGSRFGSSMTAAEAYGNRLFHGSCFHCLQHITSLNEDGVWAQVSPSSPADCMRDGRGAWIIDPILLDAGPQLLILWAQEMRGMTALPSRFGEVRIFDGLTQALASAASRPLECHLMVDAASEGPLLSANYQVYGPDGDIVMSVETLESTASQSLNRLVADQAAAIS
jgi:hypothetical protein